jgi:hypothetical protein
MYLSLLLLSILCLLCTFCLVCKSDKKQKKRSVKIPRNGDNIIFDDYNETTDSQQLY